jgi:hypothetical protein
VFSSNLITTPFAIVPLVSYHGRSCTTVVELCAVTVAYGCYGEATVEVRRMHGAFITYMLAASRGVSSGIDSDVTEDMLLEDGIYAP